MRNCRGVMSLKTEFRAASIRLLGASTTRLSAEISALKLNRFATAKAISRQKELQGGRRNCESLFLRASREA